jgi:hypothetical protein
MKNTEKTRPGRTVRGIRRHISEDRINVIFLRMIIDRHCKKL